MIFSDLDVFGNNQVNKLCNKLYAWIGADNLMICGGVARCLAGENHTPKDLDIVTKDEATFHYIHQRIGHKLKDDKFVLRITKSEKRIIIYTQLIAIELWNGKIIHAQSHHRYKGILPYIISSRTKKIK